MDFFKDETEVDPAAEFLAREQDQLAGLEDEIAPVALSTPAAPAADGESGIQGSNFSSTGLDIEIE